MAPIRIDSMIRAENPERLDEISKIARSAIRICRNLQNSSYYSTYLFYDLIKIASTLFKISDSISLLENQYVDNSKQVPTEKLDKIRSKRNLLELPKSFMD